MPDRFSVPIGRRSLPAAAIAVMLVCAAAFLATAHADFAIGIGALALVCALLVQGTPLLIVAAVPAVWLGEIVRVAGGAVSIADAFLIVGMVAALVRLDWRNRALRHGLYVVVAFQAVTLLVLVHRLTGFGAQEWAHRLLLVGGGITIGAALVRVGKLRLAAQFFVWGGVLVAMLSAVLAVTTHFAPTSPLLSKNYAGDLLATVALVALFAPGQMLSLGRLKVPVLLALAIGLLATQSRGAQIGLGIGIIVYWLCARRFDARSVLVLIAAVAAGSFIVAGFSNQLQVEDQQQFGSLFYHQQDIQAALGVWQQSPILGAGVRFWQTGLYIALQGDPHNVLALSLAEGGVVGLAAFVILLATIVAVLFRSRSPIAALAIALLAARFFHGLFDVFWVHGSLAIPWIIAGAALALPRTEPARVAPDTATSDQEATSRVSQRLSPQRA